MQRFRNNGGTEMDALVLTVFPFWKLRTADLMTYISFTYIM